jgi:YfiH family protein
VLAGYSSRGAATGAACARGSSRGVFSAFNLATHVGDDRYAVEENRRQLLHDIPALREIQWLEQVHGTRVVRAGDAALPEADACWSDTPGVACAVLTADCLPVLLCSDRGRVVAAVHCGWRGLAAGILAQTIATMPCGCEGLRAWLGPCIGPCHYPVESPVRAALMRAAPSSVSECFRPAPGTTGAWLADLKCIALRQLRAEGVRVLSVDGACTACQPARFYSYRRDRVTGRMVSLVAPAQSPPAT